LVLVVQIFQNQRNTQFHLIEEFLKIKELPVPIISKTLKNLRVS
jgi:hypothetical protein